VKASLHTDGGARGNPGPAGIGVVLEDERANVLAEVARGIGVTTNNVAEYEALIAGLELARERGVKRLEVFVDSELVASQVRGEWKIRNDRLRALAVRARSLLDGFEAAVVTHVPRARNARADRLANRGMDEAEQRGEAAEDTEQASLLE
jgi:ribonuclease HI